MILRKSSFLHEIPLGPSRLILIHAVSHLRLVVDAEVKAILDVFDRPRRAPDEVAPHAAALGLSLETLAGCLSALLERGFLTDKAPNEELACVANQLASLHGRDPGERLDSHRRAMKAGADPAWAVEAARTPGDLAPAGRRLDLILLGDCDLQMEADFLRREAATRGLDLHVAASFPDDVRFAGERRHDAVLIGALRARGVLLKRADGADLDDPVATYLDAADRLLRALRQRTSAPILIDALPEPTVQPLGLAERGADGHRNRVRRLNLALAELVETFADVHLIDTPAALAAEGAHALLDDGLVSFTHFGSPGWMLQRPSAERAAVHDRFPDLAPLVQAVGGDPYGRERVMSRAHLDTLATVLGVNRKKCVVVDLDGVLWPGVLAETGAPFAWSPEVSGLSSYIGLYVGLHEALKTLKRRGVLLACVSKNDEAVVRRLWTYADHEPRDRLLTLDDFVAWRVNWTDKVDNIESLADELGLALDSFVFIDDREIERENVKARLPGVEVWGEDLFALRRRLLTDPRLQVPRLTDTAAARSDLVRAQLARKRELGGAGADGTGLGGAGASRDFVAALDVHCRVSRLDPAAAELGRVEELFQRTTQFNTTGRRFPLAELQAMLAQGDGAIFTLNVADRFGDHGLVGAAVVSRGEILGLAMSCRVIGLGAEHVFLGEMLERLAFDHGDIQAEIILSDRNAPVRNLYLDNGFAPQGAGRWRRDLRSAEQRRA